MSPVWEVSGPSSQAAADPGCHKPPPGLGELWRNKKKQSDTGLVYGIPVSQIIFVYNIKILILREKNGKAVLDKNDDHLFKAPTSHTVHYNLHQRSN